MARKKEYVLDEATANEMVESVFNRGCLLWIEGGGWGNRKKISSEVLREHGLDPEAISAVQALIKRDEINAIRGPINRAHAWARNNSLPWISEAVHFVPKEKIQEVQEKMEKYKADLKLRLNEFLEINDDGMSRYDRCRKDFSERHPDHYDPRNYPTAERLKSLFRLRFGFHPIVPPSQAGGKVTVLTPEMLQEEDRKFKQQIKEVAELTITTIRSNAIELLKHMKDMLKDGKTFQASTVEKPKKFFQELGSLNIYGDKPLENITDDILKILNGVYAEDLRDDDEYRGAMSNIMDEVVESVESLPVVKIARDLELDF